MIIEHPILFYKGTNVLQNFPIFFAGTYRNTGVGTPRVGLPHHVTGNKYRSGNIPLCRALHPLWTFCVLSSRLLQDKNPTSRYVD